MRLQAVRESPRGLRGAEFERLVGDLLREAGAQAEERSPWEPDGDVDIAAFIPGEEQRLGTVVIQVKSGTLTSHGAAGNPARTLHVRASGRRGPRPAGL